MTTPQTPTQKITKSYVDKLSTPETGQAFVRDSELKGFAVRVTPSGAKSFILEKRIDGKVKRLTLGRYPELTAEQARKEAHKLLGRLVQVGLALSLVSSAGDRQGPDAGRRRCHLV